MGELVVGNIRARSDNGKLFFDFSYKNKRCREQTTLDDTPANRKKMKQILDRIEAEITLGQFDYGQYFPDSPRAIAFQEMKKRKNLALADTPLFSDFAKIWLNEMQAQWRKSHREGVELVLNKYVLPEFGNKELGQISKAEILEFRSKIANVKKKNGDGLSPTRINHIITPLRMILNEAANRYDFSSPYHGIKSLKLPKTDVEPFTIDEVSLIINTVRPDFKLYYLVRFFTGMRTSEIDGLQWQYIDFERRQILIRQALVRSELVYTKNDGSFRAIDMSQMVFDALQEQKKATGDKQFVFCNSQGNALYHHNVCLRVWHPLLRHLGLRKRRPYQTRHTAATLWLASGESPEWIARQMGHTTTEMLFRVYSRFVPNLTRQDGSAFERLLSGHLQLQGDNQGGSSND
jgi:integrase